MKNEENFHLIMSCLDRASEWIERAKEYSKPLQPEYCSDDDFQKVINEIESLEEKIVTKGK